MFVDGLGVGRNTTKLLEEFLTPEEIIGINFRILVGPFPNYILTHLYILYEIDIDCIIGNGPTLTLLYQEYVWSNSKEENGPNKFLIHSTCNEVMDCECRI